ncbi:unnamed protein product [Amoebophrya sp. A25]|nr:unnamed protein product [Amoebophrya sp. A25]|eukprot:GSA25T00016239001.1
MPETQSGPTTTDTMAQKTAAGKAASPPKKKDAATASVVVDPLIAKRKGQIDSFAEMPLLEKAKPYILQYSQQAATACVWTETNAIPMAHKAFENGCIIWKKVEPYLQGEDGSEIVVMLAGLGLCLFGGCFPLLIAAYEAFRMAGWDGMKSSIIDLRDEGRAALAAHKKDETVDDDGDGVPDVQQISPRDLAMRKTLLVLRVINPEKVSKAFSAVVAGLIAVLASLKLTFARSITLGATLGEVIQKRVDAKVTPVVQELVPDDAKKWVPIVFGWAGKIFAVWVACMLQTVISAFHSAIRGGQMFGVALVRYLNKTGKISHNEDESLMDEAAGYGAAGVGFLFQLYMGFSLPFPFWIVFLPASIAEYSLGTAVQWV